MLAVAGGILLALVAIVVFFVVASSPLLRILAMIAVYGVLAAVLLVLFRIDLRAVLGLIVLGLFLFGVFWALEKVVVANFGSFHSMSRAFNRWVSVKVSPPKAPNDPRHPEHLKWANREGPYSDDT